MRGLTHLLLSIVAASLFVQFFNPGSWWIKIVFGGLVVIGSFLPDIDEKHSTISMKMPVLHWFVSVFTKHRGIMHSIFIPALLTVAGFLIVPAKPYLWGLGFGYFSHLLGDVMTVDGIKPLHPFTAFKIRGVIRVGSIFEYAIALGLILFLIYF